MMATSTLCTPCEYFKIERKLSLTLAWRDESRHEGAHFEERKEKIPKMELAEQFEGVTSLTCFHTRGLCDLFLHDSGSSQLPQAHS